MATPSPSDDNFEFWVRETALNAAARVSASYVTEKMSAQEAHHYAMVLVDRFERYLNSGVKW